MPCFINNPENAGKLPARNIKTKENGVVEHIKKTFPAFDWIHDKRVQDGCSKKRPDLLLDLGSHIIIVEIDENRHSTYPESCEAKRIQTIAEDTGFRPIVFIRFNPDAYKTEDGKRITSCWKISRGVCVISKVGEWKMRLDTLVKSIKQWCETGVDVPVTIDELFF